MSAPNPSSEGSLRVLLNRVREGDELAYRRLWERYFPRLWPLAEQRLAARRRSLSDGEDMALSVLRTFFRRAELGQFEDVEGETELWRLLTRILSCKLIDLIRAQESLKRRPTGKTAFISADADIEEHGGEPAPEEIAVWHETLDRLLELAGPEREACVLLRLEGYLNEEIAERLGVSTRTVERRLRSVRDEWIRKEATET